jgi:hypothetical protein
MALFSIHPAQTKAFGVFRPQGANQFLLFRSEPRSEATSVLSSFLTAVTICISIWQTLEYISVISTETNHAGCSQPTPPACTHPQAICSLSVRARCLHRLSILTG